MNAKFDGIAKSIATKSDESLAVAKLNAVTNALQHIGGDKKRWIIEKKLPALIEKVVGNLDDQSSEDGDDETKMINN